ncbi:hypothetical protein TWF225_011162 [Orbilia oligospora]|nr:hypothetical protein TWF751_000770 [Orbilia oligospora]KAF3170188.1 hypothetical protein TWF225_011162 [Orbilia oligospora]KAF3248508.1 hypothetical protein TWF217_009106 [Orbilia oligospora]KAF3288064.1 hypothetical protein TWF132_008043 [Orbilia oligospora]
MATGIIYILITLITIAQVVLASPLPSSSFAASKTTTYTLATARPLTTTTNPTSVRFISTIPFSSSTSPTSKALKTKTLGPTIPKIQISRISKYPSGPLETSVLNERVISPSFFYASPLEVKCGEYDTTMDRLQKIINGEISYNPSSGIPPSEWAAAVREFREVVENLEYMWDSQLLMINRYRYCCLILLCNESGDIIPNPNPPNPPRTRCDTGAWEPRKCTYLIAELGQPDIQAGGPLAMTPIEQFQDAINRIPGRIRRYHPTWEWIVAPVVATHPGQTLGFAREDAGAVNVAPSGEPPFYLEFPEEGPPRGTQSDSFIDTLFDFGRWDQDPGPGGYGKGRGPGFEKRGVLLDRISEISKYEDDHRVREANEVMVTSGELAAEED